MSVYLYGVITYKPTNHQEPFNIKVTEGQKRRMLDEEEYRSFLATQFGEIACGILRLPTEVCRISIMRPEGNYYDEYLKAFASLSEEVIQSTTVDLTAGRFKNH